MNEQWKPVSGYQGFYEVSNLGHVRSIRKSKLMRQCLNVDGYLKVALVDKNGKRRNVPVHRLVLLAFVGPSPTGTEARHYPDQTKTNNKLINLSWSTNYVNQRDRDVNDTHNKGIKNKWAKLDEAKVKYIRSIKEWPYGSLIRLARRYGTSSTTIQYVRDRKSWRHI